MSNEELLDRVYWHWRYVQGQDGLQALTDYRRIVLAVIELHKPENPWGSVVCGHCYNAAWEPSGLSMDDKDFAYPCPTIQAIEKELK